MFCGEEDRRWHQRRDGIKLGRTFEEKGRVCGYKKVNDLVEEKSGKKNLEENPSSMESWLLRILTSSILKQTFLKLEHFSDAFNILW